MHIITKIFCCLGLCYALIGCSGRESTQTRTYQDAQIYPPLSLQYGTFNLGLYGTSQETHRIAVLLPTSGPRASIGKSIRIGIEAAVLGFAPNGLQVNFYDTGDGDIVQIIRRALASRPEIIIGPVFAENAKMLRDNKPENIPALSFTSDTLAIGRGVFSMALMPQNSIESILQEMSANSVKRFVTIAPDNTSGQIMAGLAKTISDTYNMDNVGLFYYTERNTDSIKNAAMSASLYRARNEACLAAKEILAETITREALSVSEKNSLTTQLENLNRTDTLGELPYDAILFLGGGEDTKSVASFLRYYGIGTDNTKFYGTPLWQDTKILSDITMSGAMFAALPDVSEEFSMIHEAATAQTPSRMTALGYDSALFAISALYSNKQPLDYMLSPSGYTGTNGLFRLRPYGQNERAMQIVKINGTGKTSIVRNAKKSFVKPVYLTNDISLDTPPAKTIKFEPINPLDYLELPERLRGTTPSWSSSTGTDSGTLSPVTFVPNTENEVTITAENYQPLSHEPISRTYIESTEVTE